MAKLKVDKSLIRELAELLDETGLTEIELGEADSRIRVARQGTVAVTAAPSVAAPLPAPASAAAAPPEDLTSHPGAVTSPMVGTAYLAGQPGDPPLVKVGDNVQQGDVLLIIEAMKTFNEIPAPRAGKVTRVLVENQAPVEYGDVLMIIE